MPEQCAPPTESLLQLCNVTEAVQGYGTIMCELPVLQGTRRMRRQQPHWQSGEAVATQGASVLGGVDGKDGAVGSDARHAKASRIW